MTSNPYNSNRSHQAYKSARGTASQMQQLIMLYEGAIKYVTQAKKAIENHKFDERFNLIDNATSIINGLRTLLDHDTHKEVATALDNYYNTLENRLIHIQCFDSLDACDATIRDLKTMRNAWLEVQEQFEDTKDSSALSSISDEDLQRATQIAQQSQTANIELNELA